MSELAQAQTWLARRRGVKEVRTFWSVARPRVSDSSEVNADREASERAPDEESTGGRPARSRGRPHQLALAVKCGPPGTRNTAHAPRPNNMRRRLAEEALETGGRTGLTFDRLLRPRKKTDAPRPREILPNNSVAVHNEEPGDNGRQSSSPGPPNRVDPRKNLGRLTERIPRAVGPNHSKVTAVDMSSGSRIVTVRPGRRTAPKPAVQWTVRRRYGGAESATTPDGTGRWTGRPSTVDGRTITVGQINAQGIDSCTRLQTLLETLSKDVTGEGGRNTLKEINMAMRISPLWCVSAALQAAVRGGEAGVDGHGTVAPSARPSNRLSTRPPVDGTPVLTTVWRRDGGLRGPPAQRRDGTIVRPSVRPTVLDGTVLSVGPCTSKSKGKKRFGQNEGGEKSEKNDKSLARHPCLYSEFSMPDTSANPTGAQMDRRTSTNRSPVVDECRCIYRSHKFANRALGIDYLYVHSYTCLTAGARTDLGLRDARIRIVSRSNDAAPPAYSIFSSSLGKRVRILPTSACYIAHYKGRSWLRARCMRCSIEFGDGPVLHFGPRSGYGPIARLPCPTAQCSTKTRKLFWLVWPVGLVSDLLVENSSQPVVLSACQLFWLVQACTSPNRQVVKRPMFITTDQLNKRFIFCSMGLKNASDSTSSP
ncbi:hypothetical protein K438DRAFT_2085838 [Mycena galopus ATCC 62051]|nr:hypothetical protein K438DRAFT_2085838 [Mycena galopus ATCC 62051]